MNPGVWQSLAFGYGVFAAPFAAAFYITARRLRADRRWTPARRARFYGDAE